MTAPCTFNSCQSRRLYSTLPYAVSLADVAFARAVAPLAVIRFFRRCSPTETGSRATTLGTGNGWAQRSFEHREDCFGNSTNLGILVRRQNSNLFNMFDEAITNCGDSGNFPFDLIIARHAENRPFLMAPPIALANDLWMNRTAIGDFTQEMANLGSIRKAPVHDQPQQKRNRRRRGTVYRPLMVNRAT